MKRNKHISKSVESDNNNSFLNNTFSKKSENKKTPRITVQNNLKTNNNSSSKSSFIVIKDNNNFIIEKAYTQQMPTKNFLEEMYIKYSKNLQKYFLKNQTGLKLIGNKYFQNLTVEEYMKKNKLNKEQFIQLLNGETRLDNKNLQNIKKDQCFLTPLPNKSRQLLNTNKEKSDFLEAERAAVVMRTFEYTHGIKSKVGIYEYKKMMMEQKKKLIRLMLNAAKIIQRWWKKKYYYICKNRNDDNFNKRLLIYNELLNRRKLKIFYDKLCNYIKYLLKPKRKIFLNKLKNKAKHSIKKIYSIYDWINNMKISHEIKLQIIDNTDLYYIKKKTLNINKNIGFVSNFYLTKKILISTKKESVGSNTKNYQIKQIILIQKIFKNFLKLKKEKETFRNSNKSQFSYINPNKILFLFNKSANSEAKLSKSNYKNKNNYNIDSKNSIKRDKNKISSEDKKEKVIGRNLPLISPLSKNKEKNDDDNEKNNDDLMNKKNNIENFKEKIENLKKNVNNFDKKKLNKKNSVGKQLNITNFKSVNDIFENNNNSKSNSNKNTNKSSRNKSNNRKSEKNIKNENANKMNNMKKNNIKLKNENKNKNNSKKSSPDKLQQKSSIANTNNKESIQNINNNSSFMSNIINSKNKKKNNMPFINKNNDKKKYINPSINNEFYFNSSSYMNKQISFGVDNAPSEIVKKNNFNSFFDNENLNENSGINNYYNLNNNIENEEEKENDNKINKNKGLKNVCISQKKSLINNMLGIEENELSLVNKKNNITNNKKDSKNNNKNNIENKNNLLLIDSLEIENSKKIDKNIIKVINSNENFEKSLPPEINSDNYQQDSTLDYRDKKLKSNQKTISTSAILHLDTSNNHINHDLNYNYQIFGQICLNYIHRPCVISGSYIYKIRKNVFSSKIHKNLENLVKIKDSFTLSKLLLNNNINKYLIIRKYMKRWKDSTERNKEPYTYSKVITSICTMDNNDKEEYFSYYCKINKSNQENDFIFLRISLGYKLLRKIFCQKELKIFFYLLKRMNRRKNKAKTYIYKRHTNNILNLLDFKIKLPILLDKIFIKKYCGFFYHKFLYFSLNINNNIEYNLDNNSTCFLIREGYKKGYFQILYNVLKERFNYEYYNTGLKFETFVKRLLNLHE